MKWPLISIGLGAIFIPLFTVSHADPLLSVPDLIRRLNSPVAEVAGDASVHLLKIAPSVNPSVVRLACETAARTQDLRAKPWIKMIILNRVGGIHVTNDEDDAVEKDLDDQDDIDEGGESVDPSKTSGTRSPFDPTTRGVCALSGGMLTVPRVDDDKEETEDSRRGFTPSDIVDALTTVLIGDEPLPVRAASARALGFTGNDKALCPLYRITKNRSENPLVQALAADSLTKIVTVLVTAHGETVTRECGSGVVLRSTGEESFVTPEILARAIEYIQKEFGAFLARMMPP